MVSNATWSGYSARMRAATCPDSKSRSCAPFLSFHVLMPEHLIESDAHLPNARIILSRALSTGIRVNGAVIIEDKSYISE